MLGEPRHTPEPWMYTPNAGRAASCVNACVGMEHPEENVADLKTALQDCMGALKAVHDDMPKHNCTAGCPDISKHVAAAQRALARAGAV